MAIGANTFQALSNKQAFAPGSDGKSWLAPFGKVPPSKTTDHESRTHHRRHAGGVERLHAAVRGGRSLKLLIAAALWTGAICATSCAQTVVGSPGAGYQHWTVKNLDNDNAPFWDAPTKSFGSGGPSTPASKNVGFCLTGTGDCVGIGSHAAAPGPLPYWGMFYDSTTDNGGAIDPKVFFHRKPSDHDPLKATLELQFTTSLEPKAINEIGWFETNATGSSLGPRHILFRGAGVPPGSQTPDPVGKKVTFKPTEHFRYYFGDVSENGCFAYTITSFNAPSPDCDGHNFVVFSEHPGAPHSTFWIAGEDPPGCGDGDCNLTLMKVSPREE